MFFTSNPIVFMTLVDFLYEQADEGVYNKHYTCILKDPLPAHVLAAAEEGKKVLAIYDHKSPDLAFLCTAQQSGKAGKEGNITILNTSSGLFSFGRKGRWEGHDVVLAINSGYRVQEAYYVDHLQNLLLSASGLIYIRTYNTLPDEHAIDHPELFTGIGLLDLSVHGLSGTAGTILGFGNTLSQVTFAHHLLQEEERAMNVFVASEYLFAFTPAFIASLSLTGKLVLVCDQVHQSLYYSWIKAQLLEHKLTHIEVRLLTPEYEKVTSILPEYFWEQAGIDAISISKRS